MSGGETTSGDAAAAVKAAEEKAAAAKKAAEDAAAAAAKAAEDAAAASEADKEAAEGKASVAKKTAEERTAASKKADEELAAAKKTAEEASESGGADPHKTAFELGHGAAILAVSSVFGVFALLKLEDDSLFRLIRDYQDSMIRLLGAAILVAVLGVVLPGLINNKTAKGFVSATLAVLASVVCFFALLLGIDALDDRGNPSVIVTPIAVKDGKVTVRAGASGAYMKSNERLLLRITAVTARAPDLARGRCFRPDPARDPGTGELEKGMEKVKELYWGEAVPTVSGEAQRTGTVTLSRKNHDYLCVWSAYALTPKKPAEHPDGVAQAEQAEGQEAQYSGVLLNLQAMSAEVVSEDDTTDDDGADASTDDAAAGESDGDDPATETSNEEPDTQADGSEE